MSKWKQFFSLKEALFLKLTYFSVLALCIAAVLVLQIEKYPSETVEGDVAKHDIIADQNYEIQDVSSTQKLRDEAASKVLPVFDFDSDFSKTMKQKISKAFSNSRAKLAELRASPSHKISEVEEKLLKDNFLENFDFSIEDADYALIRREDFSETLENSLQAVLGHTLKQPIVADKHSWDVEEDKGFVMRIIQLSAGASRDIGDQPHEKLIQDTREILNLHDARQSLEKRSPSALLKEFNLDFVEESKFQNVLKIFPAFVRSTLTYNKTETDLRRDRASKNVQVVVTKLKKGQIIIRRGDRYDAWHLNIIQGIREKREQSSLFIKFIGVFFTSLLGLVIVFQFAERHLNGFKLAWKDNYLMGIVLVMTLAMLRLGSFFIASIQSNLPISEEVSTLYYFIPVLSGPMLIGYILNAQASFVLSILIGIFSAFFFENNISLGIYHLISGIFVATFMENVDRRSGIVMAGLKVALACVAIVLCLETVMSVSLNRYPDFYGVLWFVVSAAVGAISSSFVMLALSPVFESVLNYTTNIKLLELANLNHPLLREMIVRAPGTYHHSQLVGLLSEAGARAIGANALLARVASYYHDIGKMKKPLYFIENQKGYNPHDHLAPSLSSLIIEAHVKDGIDLAEEYKLPRSISCIIPEHQGTKLIGYFYQRAKQIAEQNGETLSEADYRYKGPKPQSRESGVVMLSDAVEASVRSMPDKSPQKIQAMVEKIVNHHFVDGQLNECDLTLKDIYQVIDAFVKLLVGIYHHRIEYPDIAKKNVALVKNSDDVAAQNQNLQPSSSNSVVTPFPKAKSK